MPDNLSVLAYAKLNLSLDVTGSRPDGYHTISTVMQSVDIADTVHIEIDDVYKTDGDKIQKSQITVSCSDGDIPENSENTAYKAAKAFFEFTGINDVAVNIKIRKAIPVSAGLGGGSADAAGVIFALNKLLDTDLDDEEMEDIAEKVGMDVPFCINGGTQLAEGLGTILTPLPDITDCAFLLIKAGEKSSTKDMYEKLDSLTDINHPDTAGIVNNICEGELRDAAEMISNVFTPLWGDAAAEIIADMKECGAFGAELTGSGPYVFGIFSDEDDAKHAKQELDDKYSDILLCCPVNCGAEEK